MGTGRTSKFLASQLRSFFRRADGKELSQVTIGLPNTKPAQLPPFETVF